MLDADWYLRSDAVANSQLFRAHQQNKSWLWWYNGKPAYSGWIPEFSHTLGAPVGDARLSNGVYTRRFSTGTTVSFDTSTNEGAFVWGR